ncbi:Protein ZINC INDUCED FACILITATOR-LIKE 1 [Grifola frondosa]|uniref:Protein ZINC INDUCED FACILITATOR-LIKE 1 n=1 Tax=Grifola frondosa TaxID=5627 RepID=A0A1C7M6H8_GRIFR|nr:Protein ZINC INDUCED FACILITATOR-LIKE 1 [Grifola frondosa]
MTVQQIDEETPLLHEELRNHKPTRTPIPWGQFSILLVLQLAEPLTSQVIYPFTPDLIRNIGITHGDESRVGYYVGLMQSIFFATQAITVLHWSRALTIPVIMTGLIGLSLSMYCFGLSRTFWGLVVSLNGALNGNIGVLKSMLAEITDSTNLAQAYAYLPISWSTGSTLGPIIGGSLSRPAERFPELFGNSEFMKTYPYFLACAIPATFSVIACLVTLFFLKETVRSPISIRSLLKLHRGKTDRGTDNQIFKATLSEDESGPLPFKALLVHRVILACGNYCMLAIVDSTLRAFQPVFYSTPIHLGGLGLPPHLIGVILSFYGIFNGIMQIFLFRRTHDRFGTKTLYILGISSTLLVFATFPLLNLLAKAEGLTPTVWVAVTLHALLTIPINFSYGCSFMYITASSPNKASLGSVNGMAQMTVSIMRAIGPATANSLFSLSIDDTHHYLGGNLVYYVLSVIVCMAIWVGMQLPSKVWAISEETEESCGELGLTRTISHVASTRPNLPQRHKWLIAHTLHHAHIPLQAHYYPLTPSLCPLELRTTHIPTMATSFTQLMALSATQTRESEAAVRATLAERQRREAQKRKEIEEKDRKDREQEAKLRLKRLQEEQREQERQARLEQERQVKEREIQRREEQQRDALRYGPKKARADSSGYPASSTARQRDEVRRRRYPSSSDDDSGSGANALTREEKRKRRMELEMRHGVGSAKRSSQSSGYTKAGRRLPGGAVDITTTETTISLSPDKAQSVRKRLAAEPAKLIKLNDRAKARQGKVLDGDQAREFNDWFGKKKEAAKKTALQVASTSTPARTPPRTLLGLALSRRSAAAPHPPVPSPSLAKSATAPSPSSAKPVASAAWKAGAKPVSIMHKPPALEKSSSFSGMSMRAAPGASKLPTKAGATTSKPVFKKRPRSPSLSASPPPRKRHLSDGPSQNDISSEIWKLFGKDRSSYIQRDVMSDEEDMEADAMDLEQEELRSARIARREEEAALEEERRHEEEKRRKRKEREMREKKGQL